MLNGVLAAAPDVDTSEEAQRDKENNGDVADVDGAVGAAVSEDVEHGARAEHEEEDEQDQIPDDAVHGGCHSLYNPGEK